jgi:hypothetical protein
VGHDSGAASFGDADRFPRLDVKSIVIAAGSIKAGKAPRAHVAQFSETTKWRET